ncbi:AAA family ATPase [Alkalibaculum sp. M08DMB]|uniref:PhoH-like protein n=1 Tax=Alkalibaculum sporogenes TaxID=2655001 RepID=A0A6A7KC38_9FIRM|nr:PhoH family protein [Alkalibaculum sporogenes]MPW27078.1 AAA family ATPase [Alkalibaculum sporogenes]
MTLENEVILAINNEETLIKLHGQYDENLKIIENEFKVSLLSRDGTLKILGHKDDTLKAERAIKKIIKVILDSGQVDTQKISYIIQLVKKDEEDSYDKLNGIICYTHKGKQIRCKTLGQERYVKSIEKNEVVFGIGPAGTGKTYLAMAMAVKAFKREEVSRIILTRPAVEAGEKLGFLPGDLQDKVDPYLRPLYDALYDLMGSDAFLRFKEKGLIEVAPLAYMRGRTLDDSFIILDEAQNTTPEQMKMFLTRMGFSSKVIITGDVTQIDLPIGKISGLSKAEEILKDIPGIDFVYLTKEDVVRHKLVQKIIEAYENHDQEK